MLQTITIAFDPSLDLSPEQFANAWNTDASTQQTGQLSPSQNESAVFADPNFGVLLLETAVVIASSVLVTQINEFIKENLAQKKEAQKAKAQETTLPDGRKIIIIVREE